MELETASDKVELSTDDIAALKLKWPTKAVESELLKMRLWLRRYPARRPKMIWRFIDTWLKKSPNVVRPAPTVMYAWWSSDERTLNQGAALGLSPRPGETMAQFRDRIADKMKAVA